MLTLLVALTPLLLAPSRAHAQSPEPDEVVFPPSTALAEGIDPARVTALTDLIATFVDDDEVVGAELLVVVNGRTIAHAAFGWRDREAGVTMSPGSVFCVRSMTKPLIGAAARMLIDEGRLSERDQVARFLPSFDNDVTREVTLEQLMHHTSGLPMSLILDRDPRTLESLRAVADLGGGHALDFAPGSAFQYSDQGTDTLTAVIEAVTGAPAEAFLAERLLTPLGMTESAPLMTLAHPLRARVSANYAGSPGHWQRYWAPDDAPLFPVFLGSQGLYSTTIDYARFLDLWLRRGLGPDGRLLKARSVRATLAPGPYPMRASTGFPGLAVRYGSLMQLWVDDDGKVVVFGHTGSDGTHAWAFPKQRALVLYFTQSRGTSTGTRVEEELGRLLLGAPFDPIEAAPPLEDYLGYYREDEADLYRGIVRDGEHLALEVLGRVVARLVFVGNDRWKLAQEPDAVLQFERDAEGAVVGYRIGDHVERRFAPAPDLPLAADVASRVADVYGLARLEEVGPVHLTRKINVAKINREGTADAWLEWPNHWRFEERSADDVARYAFDGQVVRSQRGDGPVEPVEAGLATALRDETPFAHLGDWRAHFPKLTTLQRLERGGRELLVVRAGDTSGPAPTFFVDAETAQVVQVREVAVMETLGRIGRTTEYGDVREVSGMHWPFETRTQLSHPLIGEIKSTIESFEVGVQVPAGYFALEAEAPEPQGPIRRPAPAH
ncbi:MAG: serine hydrolase domain-containing protein [Planctomycetota bacterium]